MEMTTRHYLTTNKKSWVDVYQIDKPSDDQFEELWNMHPKDYDDIMIMGKMTKTPRWTQSYGQSYKFSGVQHEAHPIPTIVQGYLNIANKTKYTDTFPVQFNMALLNWYENGLHYIGPHSDDEKQMAKSKTGETVVFSISFGVTRKFRFTPKKDVDGVKLDIDLSSGTIVVMGGLTQRTHKHSVPKISGKKGEDIGRRINITFRAFSENK